MDNCPVDGMKGGLVNFKLSRKGTEHLWAKARRLSYDISSQAATVNGFTTTEKPASRSTVTSLLRAPSSPSRMWKSSPPP